MVVFNICHSVEWENEGEIQEYKIVVFCSDEEYKMLNEYAKTKTIKRKKVVLERCENIKKSYREEYLGNF